MSIGRQQRPDHRGCAVSQTRSAPAAWLAEGLLIYLTPEEARRLLTGIIELSAPGSQLAFEHSPMATATLTGQARQMPAMHQYTSLWKGGLGDPPLAHRPRMATGILRTRRTRRYLPAPGSRPGPRRVLTAIRLRS
jgi:O-methyltransferase involved in polyketide biosynthesis